MDKIRVVVTGASGQLGRDMVDCLLAQGFDAIGFGRAELDITDHESVKKRLTAFRPDAVIHAAAYTKVDQAEAEPDLAMAVNAVATGNLAKVTEELGAKLVYVSTDYVFDGQGTSPYGESHPTAPINEYGKSKLSGEKFVAQLHSRYFIVRTSWVYGKYGNNFVKTMQKLAAERSSINIVNDQFGCPTYTLDLAKCIVSLLRTDKYGIYHVSNSGSCSWYEFAQAIFEHIRRDINIHPVSTAQFPRPARRPPYSVFAHQELERNGFEGMRHWKEALADFLDNEGA